VGTASGANTGRFYGREAQRRYDIAYAQCMYAKGNEIPGMVTRPRRSYRNMPPPPPPPGSGYYPPYPDAPAPEH
jgi:hypothetical protein